MIKLKKSLKKFADLSLAGIAYFIFYSIKWLVPLKIASLMGYILGATLVYYLPYQRRKEVLNNIQLAFKEKNHKECLKIYRGSCANFVQVIFELPKLKMLTKNTKYIKINDKNNLLEKSKHKKILFFTAHIGNWNINATSFSKRANSYSIYKLPNNKYINQLMLKAMLQYDKDIEHRMINLSKKNVFFLNQKFKDHTISLQMLLDQRIREGLHDVTFFGRKAQTSHFLSILALKYDVPLIPIRTIRNSIFSNKPMFEVVIEDPIIIEKTEDNAVNTHILTQKINDKIESWVKDTPEQWFWLHRRW